MRKRDKPEISSPPNEGITKKEARKLSALRNSIQKNSRHQKFKSDFVKVGGQQPPGYGAIVGEFNNQAKEYAVLSSQMFDVQKDVMMESQTSGFAQQH